MTVLRTNSKTKLSWEVYRSPIYYAFCFKMRQCNPRLNGCVSKNAADTTSNASEGQSHIIINWFLFRYTQGS